ncbi:Hypothetical predicted protein [Mytilus galloprovincialis]|uniref:Peptidase aspartic putative domain-containing protein n=1 Tax=Mytilus galloprovincialis TaxID=29158 RepID=A0A8B6HBB7_MYTGA|nr:Hypothetical predicted protein [Mytilus galloprovincialis]
MDKFKFSFLIDSDYYWDIVEDTVIRGPGPTTVESKLGYLLSGPVKDSAGSTSSSFILKHNTEEVDLKCFGKIESMGEVSDNSIKLNKDFCETYNSNSNTMQNNAYEKSLKKEMQRDVKLAYEKRLKKEMQCDIELVEEQRRTDKMLHAKELCKNKIKLNSYQ